MQREGIFREMKLRRNYEKPSERRARERAEAIRRTCPLSASAWSARATPALPLHRCFEREIDDLGEGRGFCLAKPS